VKQVKIAPALIGPILIACVLSAFVAATLIAAGLLTYLLGHMSLGTILAAWAITSLLVIVLARLLSRLL
jgi:hypothetical protein